jgi:hypothetical protein
MANELARTEKATSRAEPLQSTYLIVALLVTFALGIATTIAAELMLFRGIPTHKTHTRQAQNAGIRSGISGGEGNRTLCLFPPPF